MADSEIPPRTTGDKVRRAIKDFATVVFGVLAALAGQAWYQGQQDREQEVEYLRQLLADTRENAARVDRAIAADSTSARTTASAMRVLLNSRSAPSDSLVHWIIDAGASSDLRVLVGTYEAIVATDDLRLVENDSLRVLLTHYDATLDAETERLHQLRGAVIATAASLGRAVPFLRGKFLGPPNATLPELASLQRDPEVASLIFALQAANATRLSGLRNLRRETRGLEAMLERELASR